MNPSLRIALVLEVLAVCGAIQLIATGRHPQRLLTIHLGRDQTDADRTLGRRVRIANALAMFAAIAVVLWSQDPSQVIGAMMIASVLSPAILVFAWVRLLRTLPEHAPGSPRYLVPLERHTARELVSVPLQLLNLALMAGCSAAYAVMIPAMPERIPVHFGADGQPNRYGSPNELWLILAMMVFYSSITWFVAWMSSRERMALVPSAADETRALQLERRQLMVRMVEWIMIGVNLSAGVCWLGLAAWGPAHVDAVVLATIAISTLSVIGPLAAYLTPLSEVGDRLRELGADGLGTRPECWRLGGTIYFAPDDPGLFVPKRSGIGSTLNFGRPAAWWLMIGIVLLPVLITVAIALAA